MKGLEWINLTGTHVTEGGVKKLQAALPNCEIYWDDPTVILETNLDQN